MVAIRVVDSYKQLAFGEDGWLKTKKGLKKIHRTAYDGDFVFGWHEKENVHGYDRYRLIR